MKRNKLIIKRNWIQIENSFHLLVDVEGKVFYKKFRVLDIKKAPKTLLELNKKVKECDLVEEIRKEFNVKKVEFI
jgi:viroplasmin and RNaseH domain-containing protein